MPLNEKVIGKKYKVETPIEITQHEGIYYALGYNEDNDAYYDNRRPGGLVIPPMYATKYSATVVGEVLFDKETGMNLAMMVHYTQKFNWKTPAKPGDKIYTEGTIPKIEVREKGGILYVATVSKNQKGEIVNEAEWSFFDRSAGSGKPDEKKSTEATPSSILWTQQMKVRNGQTWCYAEPSGDHNPIHIDNKFATDVGLGGIILQGLCTMAFSHKAVLDNCTGAEKDPLKVKTLHVQFARPVRPGETLTFKGFKIGDESGGVKYGILAENQDGKAVLRDAWAIIAK